MNHRASRIWSQVLVAVAIVAPAVAARADHGIQVTIDGGDLACLPASDVEAAIADQSADPIGSARLRIESTDGGVHVSLTAAGQLHEYTVPATACEHLADVIAAFVATTVVDGPSVVLTAVAERPEPVGALDPAGTIDLEPSVEDAALALYEWENKRLNKGWFRASPYAVADAIMMAPLAVVATVVGKDELPRQALIGFGTAAGIWAVGSALAINDRDGAYSDTVAYAAHFGGLAAMSFGMWRMDDSRPGALIAGLSHAAAAVLGTADLVANDPIGRGELRRDLDRIDTADERASLTSAELRELEARFARATSPTSAWLRASPLFAGAVASLAVAIVDDDERYTSYLSATSLLLLGLSEVGVHSKASQTYDRGARPATAAVVPTGNGVAIAGTF